MSNEQKEQAEGAISIAIVDDEKAVGELIAIYLKDITGDIKVYTHSRVCLDALKQKPVDIVIADVLMPDIDGLTILKEVKARTPATDVIMATGYADKNIAIRALRLGAFDLLEKPLNRDMLIQTVKQTVRFRSVVRERDAYAEQLSFVSFREAEQWGIQTLIGTSEALQKTLSSIRLLQRAANTSVLITGESGTGKELVARAIHVGSRRSARPFIPVNCSAVPAELAESTLFGHVRGAFTGAMADRKGSFQIAHKGTLFLDEIADTPLTVQTKLLRVLEDGIVEPVGQTGGRRLDVRIIASTNRDLKSRMEAGSFREDLYYRLAGFTIHLPPLRERKEDIPILVEHFARMFATEMGHGTPVVSKEALDLFRGYDFPGNIRELKNMVERALIESAGNEVKSPHIQFLHTSTAASRAPAPVPELADEGGEALPFNLQDAEKILIRKALAKAQGNVSAAARLLGISRTRLYRKLPAI